MEVNGSECLSFYFIFWKVISILDLTVSFSRRFIFAEFGLPFNRTEEGYIRSIEFNFRRCHLDED